MTCQTASPITSVTTKNAQLAIEHERLLGAKEEELQRMVASEKEQSVCLTVVSKTRFTSLVPAPGFRLGLSRHSATGIGEGGGSCRDGVGVRPCRSTVCPLETVWGGSERVTNYPRSPNFEWICPPRSEWTQRNRDRGGEGQSVGRSRGPPASQHGVSTAGAAGMVGARSGV